MATEAQHRFAPSVKVLLERRLPERATLAGYGALIDAYGLAVPVPRTLHASGAHHRIVEADGWRILTPRPEADTRRAPHLRAQTRGPRPCAAEAVLPLPRRRTDHLDGACHPDRRLHRRIWFLYECLTGHRLDLPDTTGGRYVPVVDPKLQYAPAGMSVARQRVRDNLPGTPALCRLVFRTAELEHHIASDLSRRAHAVVADIPPAVLARAAALLLLRDSRASYAIEGERPQLSRIERWGRTIGEAGRHELGVEELVRLQALVIGDARFVTLGVRREGGFVGEHHRTTRMPRPDHISARPDDIPSLMQGLIECERGPSRTLDAVIAAAVIAFGFVNTHPFEDGNGRVHRYLIHHVLARHAFTPPGLVFPVSATILERIDAYRATLESYSKRLQPVIEWRPTPAFNIDVPNDTSDFYRFFDATPHAAFLYACVR